VLPLADGDAAEFGDGLEPGSANGAGTAALAASDAVSELLLALERRTRGAGE
jgi:hypothetical protein